MKEHSRNKEDLKRNEDPETIAGAVSGASGAALGGGIGMMAFGPIGAVAGALAGAAGGWWAGTELHDSLIEMDRADPDLRGAHAESGANRPYGEVRHAYQLGYLAGRNPQYGDRPFDSIEPELRAAWVQAHSDDSDVDGAPSWDHIREHAIAGFRIARRRSRGD